MGSNEDLADKCMQNGHKFLKTSLLHWNPDHHNAANEFSKAAKLYEKAALPNKALDAYELAYKSYMIADPTNYEGGRCLENCAQICAKQMKEYQRAAEYYERAISMFKNTGHLLDSTVSMLTKAAKILSQELPEKAAEYYFEASEICTSLDRHREASEHCESAALLCLGLKDWTKAIKYQQALICHLEEMNSSSCGRASVSLILIHLSNNRDIVGANQVLKTCHFDAESLSLANQLVAYFDKLDGENIEILLDKYYFKDLESGFVKLARQLKTAYGQKVKEKKGVTEEERLQAEEDLLL